MKHRNLVHSKQSTSRNALRRNRAAIGGNGFETVLQENLNVMYVDYDTALVFSVPLRCPGTYKFMIKVLP